MENFFSDPIFKLGFKAWLAQMASKDISSIKYNEEKSDQFDRLMLLVNAFVEKYELKLGKVIIDPKWCVDFACSIEVLCPWEFAMDKDCVTDLANILMECDGFNIASSIDETTLTFFVDDVFVS